MEEQEIFLLDNIFKKYIKQIDRDSLRDKLLKADDKTNIYLANLPLKSTLAVTLLSIFLPGLSAGRLYLENYRFAVFMIVLNLVCNLIISFPSTRILGAVMSIALLIWQIIEIFRCRYVCHRQNYATVNGFIKKHSKIKTA